MTKKYLIIAALASLILSLGTSFTLHNFISNANTVESHVGLTETINITERDAIYSGGLQLGNSPSNILFGGTNLFLTNDYITANEDGINYYSYNEDNNFTTQIVITTDSNATNLNLVHNTLYYTSRNKIKSINLETRKFNEIKDLDNYNIDMMYVVNNSKILFLSNSTIYNYNVISKNISIEDSQPNAIGFIPSDNGIIFITVDIPNTYSININNKALICGIEKTFETSKEHLFFYERNQKDEINSDLEYKKISLDSLFNDFSENDIINVNDEQAKRFFNKNYLRSNEGVQNVLSRAYAIYNNRWKPLKDVRSDIFSGGFTLAAGSIQVGVPYSQPIQGGYVGYNLTLNGFNRESMNPNSKLYTLKGTDGCIYYGTDCSGFVSYCMGHSRLTTVGINKAYTHLGKAAISDIKIGDVFNRSTTNRHVILIVGIDSNNVYTLEQTVPYIKYKETPISQINSVFYDKKYTVYRNPNINSVPPCEADNLGNSGNI